MTRAGGMAAAALAAATLLGPAASFAGVGDAGQSVAGFLAVPAGAAAPGMGGATLAYGGDLAAGFANPAALGWVPGVAMALSHAELPDGSRQEWGSAGGKVGIARTRWAISGLYADQGTFEGRDAFNQPTGTFSASSFAVAAALAQPLGRHLSLGIATKFVSDDLGVSTGSGVTFDAGLIARAGPLSVGASAQNVGGSMTYGSVGYDFPTSYGLGISFDHRSGVRIELDANSPLDYYDELRGGIEYCWHDHFALRAGYRYEVGADAATESIGGPSFGLGAGLGGLWLDYAYLPSTVGESEQRLGIALRPGGAGPTSGGFSAKRPR